MKSSSIVFASTLFLATTGAALAQGAPAASGPNDAQNAHIDGTANPLDIHAGKLAESRGKSKDVRAFGKQMVTDHSGVNKQAVALATKLKVTPEDNPTSQSLKKGGEENVKNLKGLKGAAFDKAYVDHEVTYHEQVLDAIDKVLVPSAKNAELKDLIVKVRPAFVAHLDHAKMIQAKLGK
jgi:putative membrane protein